MKTRKPMWELLRAYHKKRGWIIYLHETEHPLTTFCTLYNIHRVKTQSDRNLNGGACI